MFDIRARIEALRWALLQAKVHQGYAERRGDIVGDILVPEHKRRVAILLAMADELEEANDSAEAIDNLLAWGDEMREKYGITREDVDRAIRVVREAKP